MAIGDDSMPLIRVCSYVDYGGLRCGDRCEINDIGVHLLGDMARTRMHSRCFTHARLNLQSRFFPASRIAKLLAKSRDGKDLSGLQSSEMRKDISYMCVSLDSDISRIKCKKCDNTCMKHAVYKNHDRDRTFKKKKGCGEIAHRNLKNLKVRKKLNSIT